MPAFYHSGIRQSTCGAVSAIVWNARQKSRSYTLIHQTRSKRPFRGVDRAEKSRWNAKGRIQQNHMTITFHSPTYRSPLGYVKAPRPALRRHNETRGEAVPVSTAGVTVAAVLVEVAVVCRASRLSENASDSAGQPSCACKTK